MNAIHCKVDQAVCGMLYVCLVTFPAVGKCWLLRIFGSRIVTPSTMQSVLLALVTTTHYQKYWLEHGNKYKICVQMAGKSVGGNVF